MKLAWWLACGISILLFIPAMGEETEKAYTNIQDLLDANRHLVEERFIDSSAQLVLNEDGYALEKDEYNETDQVICKSYYGTQEEPVLVEKFGCSKIMYAYDEAGNVSDTWYYDEEGKPVIVKNAFHLVRGFDENKNVISEAYFGPEEEPLVTGDGYHCVKITYDDGKHKLTEQFLDTDGKPVITRKGYASVKYGYDEAGNASDTYVIRESYFGKKDEPLLTEDGYHSAESTYDNEKHKISEKFLDVNGDPVVTAKGYARIDRAYDEAGNVILEHYYGADGSLTKMPGGYSAYAAEYNDAKKKTLEIYLDHDDQPMENTEKECACVRHGYDDAGNEILTSFFDVDGDPKEANGVARIARTFDLSGNVTTELHYDGNGEIILDAKGFAYIQKEFNEQKKPVRETYCDAEGNPMLIGEFATVTRQYDENGNAVYEAWFDENGEPVTLAKGYHATRNEYGTLGRPVRTEYLDENNDLVMTTAGYAIVTDEYVEAGNISLEKWYDVNGVQISQGNADYAAVRKTFNDMNKPVRIEYLDLDDQLVELPDGYAIMTDEYDASGNVISESYYNAAGEQIFLESKGYATIRKEWNDANKQTGESYLDLNGSPVMQKGGYASKKMEYEDVNEDNVDHTVKTSYYDAQGQPATIEAGYQVLIQYFDKNNVEIGEGYFNSREEPMPTKDGYWYIEMFRNEDGAIIRYYLDLNDQVVKTEIK